MINAMSSDHPRRRDAFWDALFTNNAVLVQAFGLCPVLAAGVSLKNGVALTACLFLMLTVCRLILTPLGRLLPAWLRPALYAVTAAAVLCGAGYLLNTYLSHELYTKLYLFIPLLAVDTMVVFRSAAVGNRLSVALADACGIAAGFGLVICLVSTLREITIANTVWGHPLSIDLMMPEVSLTFAAYILLGFMAAGLKAWQSARRRHGKRVSG